MLTSILLLLFSVINIVKIVVVICVRASFISVCVIIRLSLIFYY